MKNKKENPIDGLFRRKLNEEQLAPDDLLWTEIENKLEEKKPSNRFGLWMLLGTMLLCGVASYFVFFNHTSIKSNALSERNLQTENKNSVHETPLNTTATENNSIHSSTSSTINSSSISFEKSNSTSIKNNSISKNKSSDAENRTASTKNYSSVNSISATKNSDEPLENNSSIEIIKNENFTETKISSLNDAKIEKDVLQTENSNSSTEPVNEKTLADNSASNTEVKKDDPSTSIQNQNSLPNANATSSENETLPDFDSIVMTGGIPHHVIERPLGTEKKSKWFVEAGSSYLKNAESLAWHGNHANAIDQQVDTIYYMARYNNENSAATFNYNFNVGLNVKNFQFKTGINVMRFGENIAYDNIGLCFTIEGNPTLGYDTLQVHTQLNNSIVSRNGKSVNTYLGIPIQVNYTIPLKIVKLQFGVGGFAATPVKWNSYYLNKAVTGLENPYALKMINTIVLGYSLNAGIAVPISKCFEAVFNCDFRKTMSPIEKSIYGTKKTFKSSGVNLSLRYYFTNK